jgi:hypothetical protein
MGENMADAMLFEEAEELLEKAARRNLKIDESDLQKTAQHLFEKQFLLEEVKLDRAKYEIVARYPQYFDMLAYAFGRRLIIDPEKGLVGLVPIDHASEARGPRRLRVSQSRTQILLALRIAFADAASGGHYRRGMVAQIPMKDVIEILETGLGQKFEWSPHFVEDLRWAKQHRIVVGSLDEIKEEDAVIEVAPTILHIIGDNWRELAERYHGSFGQAAIEAKEQAEKEAALKKPAQEQHDGEE